MEDNAPLEQAPDQSIPAGGPDGITPPAPAPEVKAAVDPSVSRRATIEKAVKAASAKAEVAPATNAAGRKIDPATGKYVSSAPVAPAAPQAAPEAPKRAYPKSWRPELQPHWEKLPNEILDQIEKREADIFKGIEEYKAKAFPDDLKAVISPYDAMFRQQYGSTANGIKRLLELSDFATRDPQGFIQQLAQSRGLQITFAQPDPQSPEAQIPPAVQQEIASLRNTVGNLQQQAQQAAIAPYLSEVERFKAEPGRELFEDLRPLMTAFISQGAAKSLAEAYEMAEKAHPTHGQTWLAKQQEAMKKADAERAAQARAAAVQVTGAPSQATPRPVNPKDRRAVIEAAVRNAGRA